MSKRDSVPSKLQIDISSINGNNSNLPCKDNSQQEIFNYPVSTKSDKQQDNSSLKSALTSTISPNHTDTQPKEYINVMKIFSRLFQKYLPFCKGWSLMVQIISVYAVLLIIFVAVVIYSKIGELNNLTETQSTKNYYTSVVREVIDVQRDLKVQLDKMNNDLYMSNIESPVLLMRIYTQELLLHNILYTDNDNDNSPPFVFPDETADKSIDYYSGVNEAFRLSITLKKMSNNAVSQNYCINHLLPFYYHFVPVLYQNMLLQGIPLVNFYFVGSASDSSKMSPFYFKYPLEKVSIPTGASPLNNIFFDSILDPIGNQYLSEVNKDGDYEDEEQRQALLEIIKKTNWFYKLEEAVADKASQISKMIKLVKIHTDNTKEESLMKYFYIKYIIPDATKPIDPPVTKAGTVAAQLEWFKMLFAIKLNRTAMIWPYILLNDNNDINNIDHISMMNYPNTLNTLVPVSSSNIYEVDYNIDDNNTQIINLPKFIESLYQYPQTANRFHNKSKPINVKSLIIKYSEIDNITSTYSTNYSYSRDSTFFQLLVFLNHNLNYYSKYTTSEDNPTSFNPCHIKDIEKYYEKIKGYGIDCLKDFCFFNECNSTSSLYVNPKASQFLPNCYCLPLYCIDNKTPTSFSFTNEIKSYYPNEIDKFYSFNFPLKKYNEYFNLEKLQFKCRLNFYQKETGTVSSFNSKISLKKPLFDSATSLFEMFLLSNKDIDAKIVTNYDDYVNGIMWIVYLIYVVFLCITIGVLNYFMYTSAFKLKEKIRRFDGYRREIIPMCNRTNANESSYKDEDITLIPSAKMNKSSNSNDMRGYTKECEDELDQISYLIKRHLKDFKIDFDLNESINNNSSHIIQKQYIEANNVNEYKKRLFFGKKNKIRCGKDLTLNHLSMKEETNNNNDSKNEEVVVVTAQSKTEDISMNLLFEMLSMSDKSLIDFSNIKSNFYYSEDMSKSFLDVSQVKNSLNEDKSNSNEMTEEKKINNAISYYMENIHSYWKNKFFEGKSKEEE